MWREFFLKSGESRLMEDFRVEADTQVPHGMVRQTLSIQERIATQTQRHREEAKDRGKESVEDRKYRVKAASDRFNLGPI